MEVQVVGLGRGTQFLGFRVLSVDQKLVCETTAFHRNLKILGWEVVGRL
jgi:hypothetical protein